MRRIVLLGIMLLVWGLPAVAQLPEAPTPVACGDTITAELENDEMAYYGLDLNAGNTMNLKLEQIGNVNDIRFRVYDRGDNNLITLNVEVAGQAGPGNAWLHGANELTLTVPISGTYKIEVYDRNNVVGTYTLYINCVKSGVEIKAGEPPPAEEADSDPNVSLPPAFSGVGFPGLPPVDFSNVARLPLPLDVAMSGAVTPTGGEIIGFTLDAEEGDVIDLNLTRLSGNLNLGLVMLSADNQVVFQASLIISDTLFTRLTIPSTEQYTIGVFRVDLLPPDAPQATAFQVQVLPKE
ncbi:MAG: hypothetical protein K8L99_20255 [Anaerolineae bacterium]|nr:hypothetical protein [Anaerolineae bacterium]